MATTPKAKRHPRLKTISIPELSSIAVEIASNTTIPTTLIKRQMAQIQKIDILFSLFRHIQAEINDIVTMIFGPFKGLPLPSPAVSFFGSSTMKLDRIKFAAGQNETKFFINRITMNNHYSSSLVSNSETFIQKSLFIFSIIIIPYFQEKVNPFIWYKIGNLYFLRPANLCIFNRTIHRDRLIFNHSRTVDILFYGNIFSSY